MKGIQAVLIALAVLTSAPVFAQKAADKPSEIVFPVKIVAEPAKSAEDIAAEKASRKHEADDLVAQQSVADSTVTLVKISWIQLLLGVVGAIAVTASIYFSAQATRAATDAVKATDKVSRDQSRAYVHVSHAEYKSGMVPNGAGPSVTLFIKNSGATPAKWFELQYDVIVKPFDMPPMHMADFPFETPGSVYFPLGGGAEAPVSPTLIAVRQQIEDAYRNNINETTAIWIAGTITYMTFFDEKFKTEFVYELRGLPRYAEIHIGENQQGPIGTERAHEMRHAAGRVSAFEWVNS